MKLLVLLGRLLLGLAGMAFLLGMMLFMVGAYLLTLPLMRLSPQERRLRATLDLGAAAMGAYRAYTSNRVGNVGTDDDDEPNQDDDPEPPPQPAWGTQTVPLDRPPPETRA